MNALVKSIALFLLNWLDAQLTLVWVHSNIAEEGNGLMARLITMGDAPFLLAKIAQGTVAAYRIISARMDTAAGNGHLSRSPAFGGDFPFVISIPQLVTFLTPSRISSFLSEPMRSLARFAFTADTTVNSGKCISVSVNLNRFHELRSMKIYV